VAVAVPASVGVGQAFKLTVSGYNDFNETAKNDSQGCSGISSTADGGCASNSLKVFLVAKPHLCRDSATGIVRWLVKPYGLAKNAAFTSTVQVAGLKTPGPMWSAPTWTT
jgi:hypothetical protein